MKGGAALKPIFVVVTCSLLLSVVEGAIRCYCNSEECQQTGHTCISHAEKCFSKLYTVYDTGENKTDTPADEHGCVDLSVDADPSHESNCDGTGDVVKQLKRFEPLIMCCSDNMCNYRKNQDIQVDIIDAPMISTDDIHNPEDAIEEVREDNSSLQDGSQDMMFRVAVIAVPIVGGLILIVLILLAVRMLREDYNRRYDRHSSIEKAQNFIQQHFSNKKDRKKVAHQKRKSNARSKSSSEKLLDGPVHKDSHSRTEHWVESERRLIKDKPERNSDQISRSQSHTPITTNHPSKLTHV